jgi:arylformamidase
MPGTPAFSQKEKPHAMFTILSAHDYFEPQYVLRKSLPTFAEHVAEWERLSTDDHFSGRGVSVEHYGDHPRQTMEIFKATPGETGEGLAIFIHGGFWRAMERQQSRFMATPFLNRGIDCVITEYRLMPGFRLADLVADTVSALRRIAELAGAMKFSENRILAGHSAGAHLALYGAMGAREAGVPLGETAFLFFSGVFDIFAIQETSLADELKMPPEEVARWSVYSGGDLAGRPAVFLAGADETDDFKRQTYIGAQMLGRGKDNAIMLVDGANHLTLLTKFATSNAVSGQVMGMLGASFGI